MAERRLITLACEIDSHLQNDLDSDSVLENSAASLKPVEYAELERAERVIALLEKTRKNMALYGEDIQSEISESRRLDSASTRNDLAKKKDQSINDTSVRLTEDHPSRIGRFEIIRSIGQGGFARVFLARDPDLDRMVALKLPLPKTLQDEIATKRFHREAKAAAVLGHPAIVPIFEIGQSGPITFIAMAYCPGNALNKWFSEAKQKVSARTAAAIISKLSDATEHAHRRGVVHRDLKPGNILIAQDEATNSAIEDRLRITDFGLARLATETDDTLTIEGSVVGTPAYMSPEQATGSSNIGPATDLFSLGAILYELLTGKRPFSRDTHLATLKAIENAEPPTPLSLNPSVPKDLESICLKCLRKNPQSRFASAYELHADLERFLRGEPVRARPATTIEKVVSWSRRNPKLSIASAVAALAVVLGLAGTTWQWQRATANLRQSEAEVARTRRVAAFLGQTYRSPTPTADGREVKVVDVLKRSLSEIATKFSDDDATRWDLLHQIGTAYSGLGLLNESQEVLEDVYEEMQNARASPSLTSIQLLSDLADATNSNGQFSKALTYADDAYEQAVVFAGENSKLAVTSKTRQAMIRQNLGDTKEARQLYSEIVSTMESDPNASRLQLLQRKIDLARVMRIDGDADQTKSMLSKIIEELRADFGDDHPVAILASTEYMSVLMKQGDYATAVEIARQSLERSARTYGEDHPQAIKALSNFGALLSKAERHDEAVETLELCIRKSIDKFGPESPFTMVSTYCLAQAFDAKGEISAAKENYWLAYHGFRESLGGTHRRTLACANLLAKLLTKTGEHDELERLKEQVNSDKLAEKPSEGSKL